MSVAKSDGYVITLTTRDPSNPIDYQLATPLYGVSHLRVLMADMDLSRMLAVPPFSITYGQSTVYFRATNFVSGEEIADVFTDNIPLAVLQSASFDKTTMLLTVEVKAGKRLMLGQSLMDISGLPAFLTGKVKGKVNLSVFSGSSVMLLCDQIEPQFFNNVRQPLLCCFPMRPGDDTLSLLPQQSVFVPLAQHCLNRLRVEFVNEHLQPLRFANDETFAMVQLEIV